MRAAWAAWAAAASTGDDKGSPAQQRCSWRAAPGLTVGLQRLFDLPLEEIPRAIQHPGGLHSAAQHSAAGFP